MADPTKTPLVVTFTGMSPEAETIVRNIAIKLSGIVTGIIMAFLWQHGFDGHSLAAVGFNLPELVAEAVGSITLGGAAIAWGWFQSKRNTKAMVASTVTAALTGVVPEAVAAKASSEQIAAVVASPTASVR